MRDHHRLNVLAEQVVTEQLNVAHEVRHVEAAAPLDVLATFVLLIFGVGVEPGSEHIGQG